MQPVGSSTPSAPAIDRRSALALAALRHALQKKCSGREGHADDFSIAAEVTGTGVTRFVWVDAAAGDRGALGIVASSQADVIVRELFAWLCQWRARCERSACVLTAAAGGRL